MKILSMTDLLPAEVSIADAAKYLGVGRKIIYQLLEFGEIRAVRERGKIIIDPCSLREFRESGKQP
jgi:excisionase family DNA binding protein